MRNKFMLFDELGFSKQEKFLNNEYCIKLNKELDAIFNQISFNYSRGYLKLNHNIKTVPYPFQNIRSINLPKLAIDAFKLISRSKGFQNKNNYKLAVFEILEEDFQLSELRYHSDFNNDSILALIYLDGGSKNSGGAKYLQKSHKDQYLHQKPLSDREINKYKKIFNEVELFGKTGDLIFYKTNGLHSRSKIIKKRRVIKMIFSDHTKNYYNIKQNYIFDDFSIPMSIISNINKNDLKIFQYHKKLPQFLEINISNNYHLLKKHKLPNFILKIIFYLNRLITLNIKK